MDKVYLKDEMVLDKRRFVNVDVVCDCKCSLVWKDGEKGDIGSQARG
jgi:hypothetical protein